MKNKTIADEITEGLTKFADDLDNRHFNAKQPKGFDNWLDVVRDFWAETGLDTDAIELAVIINYFDSKRKNSNDAI